MEDKILWVEVHLKLTRADLKLRQEALRLAENDLKQKFGYDALLLP